MRSSVGHLWKKERVSSAGRQQICLIAVVFVSCSVFAASQYLNRSIPSREGGENEEEGRDELYQKKVCAGGRVAGRRRIRSRV